MSALDQVHHGTPLEEITFYDMVFNWGMMDGWTFFRTYGVIYTPEPRTLNTYELLIESVLNGLDSDDEGDDGFDTQDEWSFDLDQ